jgi:hypothetical protein
MRGVTVARGFMGAGGQEAGLSSCCFSAVRARSLQPADGGATTVRNLTMEELEGGSLMDPPKSSLEETDQPLALIKRVRQL